MLLGVDVGGTFTDAVLLTPATIYTAKVASTPDDQSVGVLQAVDKVIAQTGETVAPESIERLAHGMTVGTNALLERDGATTALVATQGFTDMLDIARQDRPRLYEPLISRPAPLVEDTCKVQAPERCGPNGVVTALSEHEASSVAARVLETGAESVAVCLLFSYLHPDHERLIADRLSELAPSLHVSISSEVLAQFREYERCSTTVIDAYLAPRLSRYLERLAAAAAGKGLPEPLIMRSSGGLLRTTDAVGSGAWSVLSGPAGGALGAARAADIDGDGSGLGLDMGGTSCDVCVVEGGEVLRTDSREVGGLVLQLPMVDIETVGAGGGSIAWLDAGGALHVGPESAGADPGPACYGRGGSKPTVTDAHLVLGRLPAEGALSGSVDLDPAAARSSMEGLADRLAIPIEEVAHGIIRVANQEMIGAMRRITVERGLDPRAFPLIPFGGAGPLHAADIALDLGIDRIICPQTGGALSAFGLCTAPERYDAARSVMLPMDTVGSGILEETVDELAQWALGRPLSDEFEIDARFELRYRGQSFELSIPAAGLATDPGDLTERFEALHEQLYGHRNADAEIELVTIRVAVIGTEPRLAQTTRLANLSPPPVHETQRPVYFSGHWMDAHVVSGEPAVGATFAGPAIIELSGSTLVLPPTWCAEATPGGNLVAKASAT